MIKTTPMMVSMAYPEYGKDGKEKLGGPIVFTEGDKLDLFLSSISKNSAKNMFVAIHHLKYDLENVQKKVIEALPADIESLKLVVYGCEGPVDAIVPSDSKFKKLRHLKLNFGNNASLSQKFLETLKKRLEGFSFETFHLSFPNTELKPEQLSLIDDHLINFSRLQNLGLNLIKVTKSKEISKLDLTNIGKILLKRGKDLKSISLNLSQNSVDNVTALADGLFVASDSDKIKVKLIMYNCKMNQKSISQICDTLLKFDNLEKVSLDIRENYDVKKDYPSPKIIAYCEILICAFRHMLAEGDDREVRRKYRVCY